MEDAWASAVQSERELAWAKTQIWGLVGRLEFERAERNPEFSKRNVEFVTRHGRELASAVSVSMGGTGCNAIANLANKLRATRAQQRERRARQRQAKQAKRQAKREAGLRISSTDEDSRLGSPEDKAPQCGLGRHGWERERPETLHDVGETTAREEVGVLGAGEPGAWVPAKTGQAAARRQAEALRMRAGQVKSQLLHYRRPSKPKSSPPCET